LAGALDFCGLPGCQHPQYSLFSFKQFCSAKVNTHSFQSKKDQANGKKYPAKGKNHSSYCRHPPQQVKMRVDYNPISYYNLIQV
jgi:hypothetical protein